MQLQMQTQNEKQLKKTEIQAPYIPLFIFYLSSVAKMGFFSPGFCKRLVQISSPPHFLIWTSNHFILVIPLCTNSICTPSHKLRRKSLQTAGLRSVCFSMLSCSCLFCSFLWSWWLRLAVSKTRQRFWDSQNAQHFDSAADFFYRALF